jgi:tetratricopeptide (TPR) repeat protein
MVVALALASFTGMGSAQQPNPRPSAAANQQKAAAAALASADRLADEGKVNQARAMYERAIKAGAEAQLRKDFGRARTLGLCYLNGSPQELPAAIEWLTVAHALRPQEEENRFDLAKALTWNGKHAQAAEHLRALARWRPDNKDYAIALSNSLYWNADHDAALATLDAFLQVAPSQIDVRLQYARLLGYSKRFTDSLAQYQAVVQQDPQSIAAKVGIAKVTSWQGNDDLAVNLYDQILQKYPGNNDAQVGKAFSLMWLGRSGEARQLFQQLRKKNPTDKEIAAALKSLGPAPAPARSVEGSTVEAAVIPVPAQPEDEKTSSAVASPEQQNSAPEPAPAQTPTVLDHVQTLTFAAEAAAAGGNYTEAVHRYHEALALDPKNVRLQLQIARVLSWAKSYDDAVKQYDEVLVAAPDDMNAHIERARVLSWGKQFDQSLAGYEGALTKVSGCKAADCPSERALRVEYAKVLGWSRRYDDALRQYDLLFPAGYAYTADDREAALARARVLAWSRRYPDSIAAYDRTIALGGDTFEARLGRAQAIYWSGRIRESALLLRALEVERPKDPNVSLALSGVEYNLGYNARALSLLNYAPDDAETARLRADIRSGLRPVVRFRYGFESDREEASAAATTGIKVLRYTTGVEFNVHPDVRMDVFTTITNGLTSNPILAKHSAEAVAVETMARLMFRATPWLRIAGGAGVGSTGGSVLQASADRNQHFIFEAHPTITSGNLRIDLGVSRRIADYTPLAIHDNVIHTRFTAGTSYLWRNRHRVGAEYWHGLYNVNSPEPGLPREFTTESNGGTLYAMPAWYKSDHVTFEAGMRYESFAFDEGAERIQAAATGIGSAGFFTPRLYQRYAGVVHLTFQPDDHWYIDSNVSYGPQRLFGFASLNPPPATWGNTGSFGSEVAYRIGDFRFSLAYDYFNTETPASPGLLTGAYKSHVFSFGMSKRF